MSKRKTKATLSKGRTSWCVIFRHPTCRSTSTGEKLRVRRGLGTPDEEKAKALVDQLNELLGDEEYWAISARERASKRFEQCVVSAFFDHMEPTTTDPWADRESAIPLPGGEAANDGYARVQMVGTTGAGKTTVVRQLIGADPVEDRFPSTSAAKTTVCDIEIVMDEGPYRGAVSFTPRETVRQLIADCIAAAVQSVLDNQPERDVHRRFLEHNEQRFRLSYLLGIPAVPCDEDELSDDEDVVAGEVSRTDMVTREEREHLQEKLQLYLDAINTLAESSREAYQKTAESFNIDLAAPAKTASEKEDRATIRELVEDDLVRREDFQEMVDVILDDVESRFDLLTEGELQKSRDGWPNTWAHESTNRAEFIRLVNQFSSNYAPSFGRLLTPIVQGIRVAGNFSPVWAEERPKLVLLDGQGIGHTADSTTSVSTSITKRFSLVDAIVLVDNAAQPMQAAPCSVLQTLMSSGHEDKLVICFTHFDQVDGDNLTTTRMKKDHVLGSLDNAATAIEKSHGRDAANSLRRLLPERAIFLSSIQCPLEKSAKLTRHEFSKIIEVVSSLALPPEPVEYTPVYDVANLVLVIQKATQEFHDRWRGILNFGSHSGVPAEHWTRVKALSRRLGIFREDQYDNLLPVADLIIYMQNHVSRFLSKPLRWEPTAPPEEDLTAKISIDQIRKEIFKQLHELSRTRILDERFSGWVEAYEHRGTGSTRVRARDIVGIFEGAAPVPGEMPGPDENEYVFEIRELVAKAIRSQGGTPLGWSRAELPYITAEAPGAPTRDK